MGYVKIFLLLPLWLVFATAALAESTYDCEFMNGTTTSYKEGSNTVERSPAGEMLLTISNIDAVANTALITGNAGSEKAIAFVSTRTIYIMETTGTGNVHLLAIFKTGKLSDGYLASYTRNIAYSFGGVIVSQFTGLCKIREIFGN
jgi:hypothetical protein